MIDIRVAPAAAIALALAACGGQEEASDPPRPAAPTTTVDPTGAAPPQPSPYGGDTPVGAAGTEGAAPDVQAATPGTSTAPPPPR